MSESSTYQQLRGHLAALGVRDQPRAMASRVDLLDSMTEIVDHERRFVRGGTARSYYVGVASAMPAGLEALGQAMQQRFRGQAGHASASNALELSAVHQAMQWGVRALDFVASESHRRFGGLTGLRFNIGRIEGGIKGNVIAPSCECRFNFRPLPSQAPLDLHALFSRQRTVVRAHELFPGEASAAPNRY